VKGRVRASIGGGSFIGGVDCRPSLQAESTALREAHAIELAASPGLPSDDWAWRSRGGPDTPGTWRSDDRLVEQGIAAAWKCREKKVIGGGGGT